MLVQLYLEIGTAKSFDNFFYIFVLRIDHLVCYYRTQIFCI